MHIINRIFHIFPCISDTGYCIIIKYTIYTNMLIIKMNENLKTRTRKGKNKLNSTTLHIQ